MEKTERGTPVGVDDPYAHAGVCDRLTGDGRCRFAVERPEADPAFARDRRESGYRCLVAEEATDPEDVDWSVCPHYRHRSVAEACRRCGLEERRLAGERARPLLEEHHLSYAEGSENGEERKEKVSHEITVVLCRWCHAKVHTGWARIDDDVAPDPAALAAAEARRSRELTEGFETAAERYERER
ncbi:DUF7097 family protein [Natronorarus salvus]|uniref:DUF7097 family protein n=1 Tax=Natronorarus salvus TaxID=3117733 RepID=UPI002F267EAB